MEELTKLVQNINSVLWGVYCLIPLLVGTGIYYTFRLKFVQIRKFGKVVRYTFGDLTLFGKKAGKDGMTSFQSLATAIAAQVGVDDFRAGVLPADKAEYVARLRREGHTVLMVGDGINDSPALSEADTGIAISDGAAIAREIADITIAADNLWELVELRRIAMALMARIHSNYRFVIGFNGTLIALGVAGVLPPATSATLHNLSTLGVSLRSMGRLTARTQSALGNNSRNG